MYFVRLVKSYIPIKINFNEIILTSLTEFVNWRITFFVLGPAAINDKLSTLTPYKIIAFFPCFLRLTPHLRLQFCLVTRNNQSQGVNRLETSFVDHLTLKRGRERGRQFWVCVSRYLYHRLYLSESTSAYNPAFSDVAVYLRIDTSAARPCHPLLVTRFSVPPPSLITKTFSGIEA